MLEDLKGYLHITWDDEDPDLEKIIVRGKAFLSNKAGIKLDFKDENDKQLLLDYCRYVYNHSFEMFENNFQSEILSLSLREGVKDHAKSSTENTETSS